MANTYDFLGDQRSYFMKSSMQVYTDLGNVRQYVGKTGNEKTFSPNLELIEWYDNTQARQSLFIVDIDKFDIVVSFNFMQIIDPNVIPIAWNADLDTSDPNYVYQFFGSDSNSLVEAEWRLVGQGIDGLEFMFVIRKGICIPNGDWTMGAAGEFTSMPVTLRSLQDTTIDNDKRNFSYFRIQKKALS